MKRFTLFLGHLLALFFAAAASLGLNAQTTAGQTVTVSVTKENGTATHTNNTAENGNGYFNYWTSNAASGLEGVRIASGSRNNMNYTSIGAFMFVFNNNVKTYSITAPAGYVIKSYSLKGKITQATGADATESVAAVNITPLGGTATTFTHTAETTMTVNNLSVSTTSFTSAVNAPLRVIELTVTLEKQARITLNYTTNTGHTFAMGYWFTLGSTFARPSSPSTYYTFNENGNNNLPSGNVTVDMESQTYNVALTEAFPFTAGKFYQLYLKTDTTYVTANRETAAVSIVTTAPTDAAGLWMFKRVPGTCDQFYVYNGSDFKKGLYYNVVANNKAIVLGETPSSFRVTPNNNTTYKGFQLEHPTVANACANHQTALKFWTQANDQGSSFRIIEVTAQPKVVKLAYTDELGGTFEREVALANVTDGATVGTMKTAITSAAALADYTNIVITTSDDTQIGGEGTATISLTCTNNFPFSVSKAEAKKWNVLRTRANNDGNTLISNGTKVTTGEKSSLSTLEQFDGGLWAFVKEPGTANRFKIYNHADGKALTLTNTVTGYTDVTLSESGSVFTALRKSANTVVFYIDNPNVNTIGDHHNGCLATWSDDAAPNDAGSIITVVKDETSCLNAGKYIFNQAYGCVDLPCCVNGLTHEEIEAIKAAGTVDDFLKKIKEPTRYALRTDRIYTVTFERQSVKLSADDMVKGDNTDAKRLVKAVYEEAQKKSANTLWRFVQSGENWKLVHVNSGYYLGSNVNDGGEEVSLTVVQDPQYAPEYKLNTNLFVGKVDLQNVKVGTAAKRYLHSVFQGIGSLNTTTNIILWSGNVDNSDGSRMTIQELQFFPVAISDVNYATLNLPFAVTLPTEDGLQAWKGTPGDGVIKLTEVEGTIPANTPVILTNTAGTAAKTYQFAVAYETTATAPEDNALKGTTIKETVAADASAYILKKGGNGIGMYKIDSETDRTIPTNRAYYGSTAVEAQAQMMAFDFGTPTSIDSLQTPATLTDDAWYDLNGRRVLFPAHGVYVKSNGEKIYIQ